MLCITYLPIQTEVTARLAKPMPVKTIPFLSVDGRIYPVRCEYVTEQELCECTDDRWVNTHILAVSWEPNGWRSRDDTLYDEITEGIRDVLAS